MALNLSAFTDKPQSKPAQPSTVNSKLNLSAFGYEPQYSPEQKDMIGAAVKENATNAAATKKALDTTVQPTISQAPKLDLWGTIKKKAGDLLSPVADFLTNTTPRERASVQLNADAHQEQDQGFTSIKVPLINKQVPLQQNFLTDTIKSLVEIPDRCIETVKQSQDLATKGFVPKPEYGDLKVDSYIDMNNKFYEQARAAGMGDTAARIVSGLYTVGQGALDASIVGGLLEKAALGTLDATSQSVAKKQAWEVLGMPKTEAEASKNFYELAHKFHPDKGGDEAMFKIINNANQVLKTEGIPNLIEQKIIPNVRQWSKKLLSEPGAEIAADTVASPMVSGQLPGNAPISGKPAQRVGLQIEPVKKVGYGAGDEIIGKETKQYPTIHEGGEVKMVEGKPVEIVPGIDTFLHKGDGGWIVSEASTGRYIASSASAEGAVAKAKFEISNVGEEKFKNFISEKQLSTKSPTLADMKEGDATVISADKLKDLTGDYEPKNAQIHSKNSIKLFDEALASNENPIVKFSGGLPGSGKSDFLIPDLKESHNGVIFDTPMSNYDSATKLMDKALMAGKKPELNYVIQNPKNAWEFASRRATKTGRAVDLDYFVSKAAELKPTLLRLLNEHPSIPLRIRDLRGITDPAKARVAPILDTMNNKNEIMDIVNSLEYNKDEIKKSIQNYENQRTKQIAQADSSGKGKLHQGNGSNAKAPTGKSRKAVELSQGDRANTGIKTNQTTPPTKQGSGFNLAEILKDGTVKSTKSIKNIIRELTGQIKDPELRALNERLRVEAMGSRTGKVAGREETLNRIKTVEAQKEFLDNIHDEVLRVMAKAKNALRKDIGFQRFTKEFGNNVMPRIKEKYGIKEWKNATRPQLEGVLQDLRSLEKATNFLTEKQIEGLADLAKEVGIEDLKYMPVEKVVGMLGEKAETMGTGVMQHIMNEILPTVDLKEFNPVVKKIVNQADRVFDVANKNVEETYDKFSKLITAAEKSRTGLSAGDKFSRMLVPQNREIFQAMSGMDVKLTPAEQKLVDELKSYFQKARDDLKLEKYRKNYITHLQQGLTERILNQGMIPAVMDIFKLNNRLNIPIDIMLELDNIIGSKKFFKYALERKGGLVPTMNVRKIINDYAHLYETKMALDQVLPAGQAATRLLLQPRTAQWMKRFLQNLKGRGLDSNFRTGKMGWLANVADKIVDLGYVKLLSLNWKSAVKNVIAGETNSFIWQDFSKYLEGKKKFLTNPIKVTKMAMENHILEGTFAEYSQVGLVGKTKKLQDLMMLGQQMGEYEIRGSLFASELTPEEWASGKLTPERQREIKDVVAITQGIFSKTDSPLWTQHWFGRMTMQMNRWRITNAMMTRRIINGATEEVKKGIYNGRNMRRLAKLAVMYGAGMYASYEASKAGYKTASTLVKSFGENFNSIMELLTLKPVTDAVANNPTIQSLQEISFSLLELADYMGIPGVAKPQALQFNKGIEDTYIAPIDQFGSNKKGGINVPSVNIPNINIPSVNIPSINIK